MKSFLSLVFFLTAAVYSPAQQVVRVDVGSAVAYIDSKGQVWKPDTGLFNNGSLSTCVPTSPITNTSDPKLFQAARFGPTTNPEMAYTIAGLVNGTYTVNVGFYECSYVAGQRVFNVVLQGQQVLTNFDIFKAAGGKNIANIQTFAATVTDGSLVLSFVHVKQNPVLSSIELIQKDTTPPVVLITSPVAGDITTSTSVIVSATDNIAVAQVSALLDGGALALGTQSGSNYVFIQDLTKLSLGSHTVQATAVDTSGNTATASLSFSTSARVGLTAVPVVHKVNLAWDIPVTGIPDNYRVYRRGTVGTYGPPIATIPAPGVGYVDSAVTSGQAYVYAVTAVAGGLEGPISNEVTVTVP
jgi:hypothetical protein